MWRVPGERIALALGGPTVEVERISSWFTAREMRRLVAAYNAAEDNSPAEFSALVRLFDRFLLEAQPAWDIVDHRGAVPVTVRGMARLPLGVSLPIVSAWIESFVVAEAKPASAVDAVIPPGPANAELKKRLARAKRANRKVA